MKNLFLSLLVVVLSLNTAFAASNEEGPKPVLVETSRELSFFLNSGSVDEILEKEELSRVLFVVNDLNQIVVLQVQSENPEIQTYIKNALNYKMLSTKQLKIGENYFFIVKFKIAEK